MNNTSRQRVSLTDARTLLRRIHYATDVYYHGCQWNQQIFLPALQLVEQSSLDTDRRTAAGAYYVLGDVHDFNGAPLAAIHAYRRSARLWPAMGAAWREIANMYEVLGQHTKAIRMLRKAVRTDPTDDTTIADLHMFEECSLSSPIYRTDDVFWQSSELLASSKFSRAIAVFDGKRSVRANRYRARVYGAMDDAPRVLELWRRIAGQKGRPNIDSADWFFLPTSVWHHPDFWLILSQIAPRIDDWSLLKGHQSLRDAGIGGRELFGLFLRYHLARTQHNTAAARELSKRHPKWTEAANLVNRMKAK